MRSFLKRDERGDDGEQKYTTKMKLKLAPPDNEGEYAVPMFNEMHERVSLRENCNSNSKAQAIVHPEFVYFIGSSKKAKYGLSLQVKQIRVIPNALGDMDMPQFLDPLPNADGSDAQNHTAKQESTEKMEDSEEQHNADETEGAIPGYSDRPTQTQMRIQKLQQ